jgi:hypothetical protein
MQRDPGLVATSLIRWLTAGITAMILLPRLNAQTRGSSSGFTVSFGSRHTGFAGHPGLGRGLQRPSAFLGSPYFYADGSSAPVPGEPANPQVVFLQAAPAPEPVPEKPRQALMIELQGDRYVRLGDGAAPHEAATSKDLPASVSTAPRTVPPNRLADANLPPAVLVFRDGHQQEVRDYTIAGGILYARGNYWNDGYWNRKIPLSALNLPASLRASENNGVKFILPASANEVITRP